MAVWEAKVTARLGEEVQRIVWVGVLVGEQQLTSIHAHPQLLSGRVPVKPCSEVQWQASCMGRNVHQGS